MVQRGVISFYHYGDSRGCCTNPSKNAMRSITLHDRTADFITWEKGFLTHRSARWLTERGYHVLLLNTREHTFGDSFSIIF